MIFCQNYDIIYTTILNDREDYVGMRSNVALLSFFRLSFVGLLGNTRNLELTVTRKFDFDCTFNFVSELRYLG